MSDYINGIDTFKELYTDHFQAVWGFCNSYLKDKEQAMDATQEAFFKLYERLNDSYTKQNAVAFIYITAKNICMGILRRNKFTIEDAEKLKEELPSEDSFLEEIATQEMIRCVHAAISQLSGRSLEITTLALEGKSNPEIATILGISLNSVKSLKKRNVHPITQDHRAQIHHTFLRLYFPKKVHLIRHSEKYRWILTFFFYRGKGMLRTANRFRQ